MTRMTGPDCVVMCNLINTYIHTYIHTVAAGVCNGPRLGWSVRSSGFPLRDLHGNPGDRCMAIDDEFIGQASVASQC